MQFRDGKWGAQRRRAEGASLTFGEGSGYLNNSKQSHYNVGCTTTLLLQCFFEMVSVVLQGSGRNARLPPSYLRTLTPEVETFSKRLAIRLVQQIR